MIRDERDNWKRQWESAMAENARLRRRVQELETHRDALKIHSDQLEREFERRVEASRMEHRHDGDRLHRLARSMPGVIYQWYERTNGERGFYYVSERARDIFGIDPERAVADYRECIHVHRDDMERFESSIMHAVDNMTDWNFEGRLLMPAGRILWFRGISTPIQVSSDEVVFNGIMLDITREKEAEDRFRTVMEESTTAHVILHEMDIVDCNRAAIELFGKQSREQVMQSTPAELVSLHQCSPNRARRRGLAFLLRAYREGEGTMSWTVQGACGMEQTWDVFLKRVMISGEPHMLVSIHNVTARARQEAELRKLSMIAERTTTGVSVTDTEARLVWCNQAFENITGYSFEELVGVNPGDILQGPDTDPTAVEHILECVRERRPFRTELLNYNKEGRPYWIMLDGNPLFDGEGRCTGFIGIQTDITERKTYERSLIRRDQLLRGLSSVQQLLLQEPQTFAELCQRTFPILAQAAEMDFVKLVILDASYATTESPKRWVNAESLADPHYARLVDSLTAARLKDIFFDHICETDGCTFTTRIEVPKSGEGKEESHARCLFAPIHVMQRVVGFIFFARGPHRSGWAESEANIFSAVANSYGSVIERQHNERDMLEARKRAEKLNERLEEQILRINDLAVKAEEASVAKSRFLANMSHEIRTPLNAILGYAQILSRQEELEPRQKEQLETIRSSGEHLLRLINDILDLSRIEAGKFALQMEPVSIAPLLDEVCSILRVKADEKQLRLEWCWENAEGGRPMPVSIFSDARVLRQILVNLIGNAIKFTRQGHVKVKLVPLSAEDPELQLRIAVEDTGIGIAEHDLEKLFAEFEQVGEESRQAGGTGLGLAISRKLAEFLGSELKVKSTLGQGSTFWFDLSTLQIPLEEEGDEPQLATSRGSHRYRGRKRVALVIDDNEVNRRLLADMLDGLGIDSMAAPNGAKGLERARERMPDIVFCDVVMPVLDGYGYIAEHRADPQLKDIPAVVVTASVAGASEGDLVHKGYDAFIPKPVSVPQLERELTRLLQLEWEPGDTPPTAANAPQADDSPLQEITGPAPETMEQLLSAVQMGDIDALQEMANALKQEPETRAFAAKIEPMVRSLRLGDLERFLETFSHTIKADV